MPEEAYKRCSRCGEEKALSEFNRNRAKKDGRQTYCRPCSNSNNREWYAENDDHHRENASRWARENRERKAAVQKDWQTRNRERFLETSRRAAQRRRPRQRAAARKHYRENSAKTLARVKLYQAVRDGKVVRPDRCERCAGTGQPFSNGRHPIEGHHHDYSKPLDVEWLCFDCHTAIHTDEKGGTSVDSSERTAGPRRCVRDQRGQ